MRRILTALMGILLVLSSCKKEESLERGLPAKGSLQDNGGDCLPKKLGGAYVAGQALTDSNYLEVTVEVTQPGNFEIFTDTVNGYYFSGEGKFTAQGPYVVRLTGKGTPAAESDDPFTVFFDSTACFLDVTVIAGGSSGGTAAYTLQAGTNGTCAAATPVGTYTQGTVLTSANKVTVTVNVTNPGTWTISTPSVAGFAFSGAGTFTTAGVQTVDLVATGIPALSGVQTFTVNAGTSCSFDVTIGAGTAPPPVTGVYFPLTANSWWSYDDGAGSDTVKTSNTGSVTLNGKTYLRFVNFYELGGSDTSFYRKDPATNSYYQYADTTGFGDAGIRFNQPNLEVLFLRDALATNAVMTTDIQASYLGTPVTLRFEYKVLDANTSITVNGKNFTNVYKIQALIKAGIAGSFADVSDPIDYYYAKDIGLIKVTDGTYSQDILNWKVN